MVKVNVDAAIMGDNTVGLGCVFRDDAGTLVGLGARRLHVNWEAPMAAFAAARCSLWCVDCLKAWF